MHTILPFLFTTLCVCPRLLAAEVSERNSRDLDDGHHDFYICQAFDTDGFIVAMQMGRDEGLARVKTWEICARHQLDCWQIQCYEQF